MNRKRLFPNLSHVAYITLIPKPLKENTKKKHKLILHMNVDVKILNKSVFCFVF